MKELNSLDLLNRVIKSVNLIIFLFNQDWGPTIVAVRVVRVVVVRVRHTIVATIDTVGRFAT